MSDFFLVFVTRSGCHLCEEAEPVVRRLAVQVGARLKLQDVETDPVLLAEYGTRIPVVLDPFGRVLAEGRIDGRSLKKTLDARR